MGCRAADVPFHMVAELARCMIGIVGWACMARRWIVVAIWWGLADYVGRHSYRLSALSYTGAINCEYRPDDADIGEILLALNLL
jgi:hypothetical protein